MKSIVFSFALFVSQSIAATVTLNPVQDATLFEDAAGGLSGGGTSRIYVGRVGTNDPTPLRRGLLQFDLSAIPTGSTINSVQLTLSAVQVQNTNSQSVSVHRVTTAWNAGTKVSLGGAGAPADPGDATWLHSSNPTLWANAGGDFLGLSSATTAVSALGLYNWSGANMVADVTFWLANPASNSGWLLSGNEGTSQSVKVFASMESPNDRPSLLVDFTAIPEPQTALLSLLGLSWVICRRRAL